MTLTLLDIYNKVTGQPLSIFETDISDQGEVDHKVLTSIQKALRVLWDAYPYSFRLKNLDITTTADQKDYEQPTGIVVKDGVKLTDNGNILRLAEKYKHFDNAAGTPEQFYIRYNKINFYPVPDKEYCVSVDYNTFYMAKSSDGTSKYNLSELDDVLDIPEMFEDLFLTALMNKAMLNALGSITSSFYQSYLQQFIEAYKSLIINSDSVEKDTRIKW